MNKPPFFTVVIPTYNRADLLPESIRSVLNQTCTDFEIIVVDNFSSDDTPAVMEAFLKDERIRYFRNDKNMERAYSRNVGFRNARGRFLTLLDSDDIMYPNCLQDAKDYTVSGTEKVFHNLYEFIDQDGKPTKPIHLPEIDNQYKAICKSNFLSCIGVFVHEEIYERFFFTEDLRMIGSEDYEIWFRILGYYKVGRIKKVNCGIREHLGRSVYSSMYENLGYQKDQIIGIIQKDPVLLGKYKNYIGYIHANYYFHQAIHSLHKGEKSRAFNYFVKSVVKGKGMLQSKRSPAFIKNFALRFFKK
jgi:glycosyltransferase involved in cell wall biosynthesis